MWNVYFFNVLKPHPNISSMILEATETVSIGYRSSDQLYSKPPEQKIVKVESYSNKRLVLCSYYFGLERQDMLFFLSEYCINFTNVSGVKISLYFVFKFYK